MTLTHLLPAAAGLLLLMIAGCTPHSKTNPVSTTQPLATQVSTQETTAPAVDANHDAPARDLRY